MPPPRTGDAAVDLLLAAAHRVRVTVDEALRASVGLSLARFKVLRLLAETGPCRLRDLADAVTVAPRTMTETVDALAADGLVTRRSHPTDRRAVLLALTEAGQEALAEGQRRQADSVAVLTRRLNAPQRARLVELLSLIAVDEPRGDATGHETTG
ncbi:putative transcription regulator protein [Frankia canadensis]|uniref:Putative transcription regulator protein n=1 Tax=Frankia canadensis TaxID=1836972 RepID=A0A2I2L2M7_9ACTN|nr:MarR family transcriptional regulator [Frankia canadensis]SNQ52169.1 putative transcription regulator protein [Frankia canadensis]SOU59459.1 putative transcription regulator protein [Frankia canadensis]